MHGYSGPLKVSYGGAFTSIGKDFLGMITQYEKTRGTTDDTNDLFNCNIFGVSGLISCASITRLTVFPEVAKVRCTRDVQNTQ